MISWQKEIMKIANDLCLNISKVREIVNTVDTLTVPQGEQPDSWKYDRAWARLKPLIMTI